MRRAAVLLLALCLVLAPALLISDSADGAGPFTLQGYVMNEQRQGLDDAVVMIENVSSGTVYTTNTDSQGHYILDVPLEGNYNISVSFTNFSADPYTNVAVPGSPGSLFNFTLVELLGLVKGFVTDGSVPVNGATVHLSNELYNYTAVSQSPLGEYEILGIQPGVYVASAEKIGFERNNYPAPVVVTRSTPTEVNFTLAEQPATLFGKVLNQNNNPLKGVRVSISSTDYDSISTTDEDGNYSFIGLAAGDYSVTFELEGYQTDTEDIALGPFEERRLDVAMERDISNQTAVLFGFDLPHSIMIVALMVGVALVVLGSILTIRVRNKPERLARIEIEAEEEPKE